MSINLLKAEKICKTYAGRKVVNEVSLSVGYGEIVGLLGPNGAGKTTSFYMIVGLVPAEAGRVALADEDVTHMPMYRRARMGMGYLAQEPSIFRKLTVEENIMAILETLNLSQKEREMKLDELLDELSIAHLRRSRAYTLSGGERRRLEITRALVTNPKLLMLDEPFSGVDPIAVYDVQQIIIRLREKGLGILITDHNVRETLKVVDRAYLICSGRVETTGTAEFLLNDPRSRDLYLGPDFSM
ncbi:MAG: LPS export ABC transporter ATP-binding protein [Verrucomicrobiae bacterium]|nr:LPS export ABC transporter ATP-binding protein [Verrucomicrobiae bacterium]